MLDHEAGSVPDTFVARMFIVTTLDMLDHADGRLPPRIGLLCSWRYITFVMLLHEEGSVPDKLFS